MSTQTHLNRERRVSLDRLNAVRIIIVIMIAFGYASTMPLGPGNPELLAHLGHDPSWIGIQLLFFFSGYLALRSVRRHGSSVKYLTSRIIRNVPLLAVCTLVAVLVIYPLLGASSDGFTATVKKLALYFFETVTCTDPGQVLPGLLDDAKYMCLIQGAIWTFKWGMIAHVATAIGTRLGLFRHNIIVAALAVLVLITHFIAAYVLAKQNPEWLATPALALRLAYPFMVGMTLYAYQDKLPIRTLTRFVILGLLISTALFQYQYMKWTPLIEIQLTLFWAYALFLLATSKTPKLAALNNWPNIVLGLYLANWPVSQIWLLLMPETTSWELIALSLPTTVIIAWLGHQLVSKPIYARAQFSSRRQVAIDPAVLYPVVKRT